MQNELRKNMDQIMEVAHDSIPATYKAHAVSYAHEGLIGEGFIINMQAYPHDTLAHVRLWENGKFEVSSPASPGIMGEYASRVQTALKAAHHLVCGAKTIAVEFKGDGSGLKLLGEQ
jgi:hypothetical protein